MKATRIAAAAALLAAVLVAPGPATAQAPGDELPGADARCDGLDPAVCLLPWPNDHFTVADDSTDTGRRLNLDILSMPRNIANKPIEPIDHNRNDGFSPGTPIVTKVPGLDNEAAFANTDPVTLHDIGKYKHPHAPIVVLNAATGEPHPIWSELDAQASTDADRVLIVRPAVNFEEGQRYIVALRNLKDADGNTIAPQPAFAALAEEGADGARDEHYESEIFPTLEDNKIDRDELYLAWDFTVASERNLSERMLSIRDDAFAQLGDTDLADLEVEGDSPDFVVTEVEDFAPCGSDGCQEGENDSLARRVTGRVLVPCYLDQPGCPTGSKFVYAPGSTIPARIPGNTYPAVFICNIPRSLVDGETVEQGRPTLVGHGLLGTADQVNGGKFTKMGREHGFVFCGADWIGMSQEDIPNAVTILADLGRFSTLADRSQQGFLNFMYIGRALIHPDGFSSDPAFRFTVGEQTASAIDTSRLYYAGGSQGGIMGGALTAVAPDFTRAYLGVPAMNYSTLLQRSIDFDTYSIVMYNAYPNEIERQVLFALIQTLWDRAESNGYAHHMTTDPYPNTPPHEVLMHEAFGDHQVTNWATEVMARTVGARLRKPELDPGRSPLAVPFWGIREIEEFPFAGSALMVADVGPLRDEGGETKGTTPPPVENRANDQGVDPHGPDQSETEEGQLQVAAFLTPEGLVIDICGELPCYLDGWLGALNQ